MTHHLASNKKVLLRERKSHTARRVAALFPNLLKGGTPSSPDGGGGGWYPIQSQLGGGRVPHPVPRGYPIQS